MKIVSKSILQMLRTPVRTALFLALLSLSAMLLTLGAQLYLLSAENTRKLEEVFVTIGTVEQKPVSVSTLTVWDANEQDYVTKGHTVREYSPLISVDTLYFEGADYIIPPKQMPYYGAYLPEYEKNRLDMGHSPIAAQRESMPVLELEPVEDCVPDHPVRMKITKKLYDVFGEDVKRTEEGQWETLWFCDHYNTDPKPLYAGKRYVMALDHRIGHTYPDELAFEYRPNDYETNYAASTQYSPDGQPIPDELPMDAAWDEVTEGFYETPRGRKWLALAEAMYKAEKTIPVVPAYSTELLMSFYNGNASIIDGRDISEEEYHNGEKVCIVSQDFSRLNGLALGDKLTLPLYFANYRNSASIDFSPNGYEVGAPVHLLNAKGEQYRVFEEKEYIIVGIYNEVNKVERSAGYEMGGNAVVIPAASVENSDGNNILDYGPMMGYNTVFQIPNGSIERYKTAFEKQGVEELEITFYDRGYTQLKEGLDQIKVFAFALFSAGVLIAFLILLFFCQRFIGKQKKRTAIERSLGMNKAYCTLSLLSGIIVIALIGAIAGSTAGYFLTGAAMGRFAGNIQTETFNTDFSSWANAADAKTEVQMNADAEPLVCAATGAFMVIMSAGIALIGIIGNLRSEPLKLLSTRET